MEQVPDGSDRFAIVEEEGRVLLVQKGADGSKAKEFLNIEDRQPHVSTEQGLLGLAFHPGFKTNGLFYLFYSQQKPRRSVISERKVSAGDPDARTPMPNVSCWKFPSPPKSIKAAN